MSNYDFLKRRIQGIRTAIKAAKEKSIAFQRTVYIHYAGNDMFFVLLSPSFCYYSETKIVAKYFNGNRHRN
jgi:hypothetical protein